MALFIQAYDQLESLTKIHLMIASDYDPGMSFTPSDYKAQVSAQSTQNDLTSSHHFFKVSYTQRKSSIGGHLLWYLCNHPIAVGGDVMICPRSSNDIIQIEPSGSLKKLLELGGGWTSFYQRSSGKIDAVIFYDAAETRPGNLEKGHAYITKDVHGECIRMDRHVILVHELSHPATMHSFTQENPLSEDQLDQFEETAVHFENSYRSWFELPERSVGLVVPEGTQGFCP